MSECVLEDAGFELYPLSTYVCSACDQQVSVRMKDLRSHFLSDFTNLEPKHADAMAEAALISEKPFNSFLDFYCPGCHNPVRIYYGGGVAGKGTFGCTLYFVVEGAA